jgi:hypothetical protein
MHYYFKNIAQTNPMRAIVLILIGLAMWLLSLTNGNGWSTVGVGFVLVTLNSLLAMQYAYRLGWSNLPSGLLAATMWMALSTLTAYQLCWQVHLVVFQMLVAGLIVSRLNIQTEAKEQAFLISLFCCILSPKFVIAGIGIVYLLVALMLRTRLTWRVIMASIIAVAMYVLYAFIFRYMGWGEMLWKENIPTLPLLWWGIGGGVYLLTWLILLLVFNKASFFSGVLYLIYLTLLTIAGVAFITPLFDTYVLPFLLTLFS